MSNISLLQFIGMFIEGLLSRIILHTEWYNIHPNLFRYTWIDQLGVIVVYACSQIWLVLLSIIRDPVVSFAPVKNILVIYLLIYAVNFLIELCKKIFIC